MGFNDTHISNLLPPRPGPTVGGLDGGGPISRSRGRVGVQGIPIGIFHPSFLAS